MKMKKMVAMFASISFIATNAFAMPISLLGNNQISDMPYWWSKDAVETAIEEDILEVKNSLVRPQEVLTRAEMAHGISSVFGAFEKADISSYLDVNENSEYYEDLQKAVAIGAFSGYEDRTLRPENNITREEMFTVIYKTLKMDDGSRFLLNKFSDKNLISDWAEDATIAMLANNYIAGNANGTINPKGNITREEFAQIISNIVDKYYTEPKTYTLENVKTAMINNKGVTLKDSIIDGDLIIGDGVGDGEVVLNNVKVEGRTIVRGGGENSIKLLNGTELKGKIVINNLYSKVRIYNSKSIVSKVDVETNVILEGDFDEININKAVEVETKGNINNIVANESAEIKVSKGKVNNIKFLGNADNSIVKGSGKVTNVEAYSDNIKVEVKGAKVIARDNVSGVTAGGKKVEAGKTVTIANKSSSGGSSGSSSSKKPEKIEIPNLELTDIANGGKIDLGENYDKFKVSYVDSYGRYTTSWYTATNRYLTSERVNGFGSGWDLNTKVVKVKNGDEEKSIRIRPDVPEFDIDKINSLVNIEVSDADKYEFCNLGEHIRFDAFKVVGGSSQSGKDGTIRIETYTVGDAELRIRLKKTAELLESVPFKVDMYSGKITEISDVLTDEENNRYRIIKIDDQDTGIIEEFNIISANPEDVYVVNGGTGKNLENMNLEVNDFITVYKTYDEYTGSSYYYKNIFINNIVLNERNVPTFSVEDGILDFGENYSKYGMSTPENWWYMARPSNRTEREIDFNKTMAFDEEVVILNSNNIVQKIKIRDEKDTLRNAVKVDYENRTLTVPNKDDYEYSIGSFNEVAYKSWNEFTSETINISDKETNIYVRKKVGKLGNGVASYPESFIFPEKLAISVPDLILTDIENGGKIDLGENWNKFETTSTTGTYIEETGWYKPTSRYLTRGDLRADILKVRYNGEEKSVQLRSEKPEFTFNKLTGTLNISEGDFDKYEISSMNIPKNFNQNNIDYNELSYHNLTTTNLNRLFQYNDIIFIREKATDKLLPSKPWCISVFSGKITQIGEVAGASYKYRKLEIEDEAYDKTREFEIVYENSADTYYSRVGTAKNLEELDFNVGDFITIYKTYDERANIEQGGYILGEKIIYITNIILENVDVPTFSINDGLLELGDEYNKYELCAASAWWYSSVSSTYFKPNTSTVDVNTSIKENISKLSIINNNRVVQNLIIRDSDDYPRISGVDYESRLVKIKDYDGYEYRFDLEAWQDVTSSNIQVPERKCSVEIRKKVSSLGNGVKPQSSKLQFERKPTENEKSAMHYLNRNDYFESTNKMWRINFDGNIEKADFIVYLCKLHGINSEDVEDEGNETAGFTDIANIWQRPWIAYAVKKGIIEADSDKFNPKENVTKAQAYKYFVEALTDEEVTDYSKKAEELGITKNVKSSAGLTYGDFLIILYNTHCIKYNERNRFTIYELNVESSTGKSLEDSTEFCVYVDASPELKYVRLDIGYFTAESNGKLLCGKVIKEILNDEVKFSFEECFGDTEVNLEDYELMLCISLSEYEDMRRVSSKSYSGYTYNGQ